jgi:Holliday junction resolvase RusA-like endonuclease
MLSIYFEVTGDPVGKGRPKFARHGNYVRTYTPEKTVFYEDHVAHAAKVAMKDLKPFDGAVELTIQAVKQVPASWSRKRQIMALEGKIKPPKPDVDNIAKSIMDAMENICFDSDVQVYKLMIVKRYGDAGSASVHLSGEYLDAD